MHRTEAPRGSCVQPKYEHPKAPGLKLRLRKVLDEWHVLHVCQVGQKVRQFVGRSRAETGHISGGSRRVSRRIWHYGKQGGSLIRSRPGKMHRLEMECEKLRPFFGVVITSPYCIVGRHIAKLYCVPYYVDVLDVPYYIAKFLVPTIKSWLYNFWGRYEKFWLSAILHYIAILVGR